MNNEEATILRQTVIDHDGLAAVEARETAARALTRPAQSDQLMNLMSKAVDDDGKLDIDMVERLISAKERWDAIEAKKAYVEAMARLKETEDLTITKDKHVQFPSKGGQTSYHHATIGNVVAVLGGALGRNGFSHRWDTKQAGGKIATTCIVTHRLGHSESLTLEASADESGGKNAIQAIISTKSYLERHTLTGLVGVATRDQEDDDGRAGAAEAAEPEDRKVINAWIAVIDEVETTEALAEKRQAIIDDYRGLTNVPDALTGAIVRRKRELSPPA